MNRIKKFDLFLLEKFPLLWHTKLCYVLLYSLFLSVIFYFWGYFETTQSRINSVDISYYFKQSFANYFQAIFFIIGITFWAITYFRKNAVKNFYPLQRFYFTRLFIHFLLIFWSLSWPSNTFYWGVKQKVTQLVNTEELSREIETINLARAFLPSHSGNYDVESWITFKYPDVQLKEMDSRDSTWSNNYGNCYEAGGTIDHAVKYHAENFPEATENVQGHTIQFLKTKCICSESNCNPFCLRFVVKPVKYADLTSNNWYDLKNYNDQLFDSAYFNYPEWNIFESYAHLFNRSYYQYTDFVEGGNSSLEVNRKVNALLQKPSSKNITVLVKKYEQLLTKYQIRHNLEVDTILNYLFNHPESIEYKTLVANDEWSMEDTFKARSKFPSLEAYQHFRNYSEYHSHDYPPAYFVNEGQLRTLFDNVKKAGNPYIDWHQLIGTLGLAIGLSFLFLLFSFGDLLTLLLTIPFGGILIVLNVLCIGFLTSFGIHKNFETKISLQFISFMLLMYGLLAVFFHSKKVHKRILNVTFYICFVLTIFLPHALLFLLDNLFQKEVLSSCETWYTQHTPMYYWLEDPLIAILLPVPFVILFMKFIKPIHSKAD